MVTVAAWPGGKFDLQRLRSLENGRRRGWTWGKCAQSVGLSSGIYAKQLLWDFYVSEYMRDHPAPPRYYSFEDASFSWEVLDTRPYAEWLTQQRNYARYYLHLLTPKGKWHYWYVMECDENGQVGREVLDNGDAP